MILDGHGSHVTPEFIEYADQHKILLMIFPPHSTHRLQPLDVSLFKPLSTAYSDELSHFLERNEPGACSYQQIRLCTSVLEGLANVVKKATIVNSFKTTGICPPDASVVLKEVRNTTPEGESSSGVPNSTYWRQLRQVIKENAKEPSSEAVKELTAAVHSLTAKVDLLTEQNQGLQEQVVYKKRRLKKSKPLSLQQREEYHGGAVFWSPRKVREAQYRQRIKEKELVELQHQKVVQKVEKEAAKLQREREAQERRKERERAKGVREKERAEKAAEKERQREVKNSLKAIKLSQTGKRKASQAASSNTKRQKRSGDAGDACAVAEAPQPPPHVTTRHGRNVTLPSKYR